MSLATPARNVMFAPSHHFDINSECRETICRAYVKRNSEKVRRGRYTESFFKGFRIGNVNEILRITNI